MINENAEPIRSTSFIAQAVEVMASVTEWLATLASGGVLVLLFIAVVLRNVFGLAYGWMDDLMRYLMIWMVYLSVMRLSMKNNHINVDVFYTRLPAKLQRLTQILIALLAIGLCLYMTYLGYLMTRQVIGFGQRSNSGTLPAYIGYGIIPISFLLSAVAYTYFLFSVGNRSGKAK